MLRAIIPLETHGQFTQYVDAQAQGAHSKRSTHLSLAYLQDTLVRTAGSAKKVCSIQRTKHFQRGWDDYMLHFLSTTCLSWLCARVVGRAGTERPGQTSCSELDPWRSARSANPQELSGVTGPPATEGRAACARPRFP